MILDALNHFGPIMLAFLANFPAESRSVLVLEVDTMMCREVEKSSATGPSEGS